MDNTIADQLQALNMVALTFATAAAFIHRLNPAQNPPVVPMDIVARVTKWDPPAVVGMVQTAMHACVTVFRSGVQRLMDHHSAQA